jgi:hypothetical protein
MGFRRYVVGCYFQEATAASRYCTLLQLQQQLLQYAMVRPQLRVLLYCRGWFGMQQMMLLVCQLLLHGAVGIVWEVRRTAVGLYHSTAGHMQTNLHR